MDPLIIESTSSFY